MREVTLELIAHIRVRVPDSRSPQQIEKAAVARLQYLMQPLVDDGTIAWSSDAAPVTSRVVRP